MGSTPLMQRAMPENKQEKITGAYVIHLSRVLFCRLSLLIRFVFIRNIWICRSRAHGLVIHISNFGGPHHEMINQRGKKEKKKKRRQLGDQNHSLFDCLMWTVWNIAAIFFYFAYKCVCIFQFPTINPTVKAMVMYILIIGSKMSTRFLVRFRS